MLPSRICRFVKDVGFYSVNRSSRLVEPGNSINYSQLTVANQQLQSTISCQLLPILCKSNCHQLRNSKCITRICSISPKSIFLYPWELIMCNCEDFLPLLIILTWISFSAPFTHEFIINCICRISQWASTALFTRNGSTWARILLRDRYLQLTPVELN